MRATMGSRGRKSGAELLTEAVHGKRDADPVVAVIDSTRQRLLAPSSMSPQAKTLFDEIVTHCDARHVRPAERPLLMQYVHALLLGSTTPIKSAKTATLARAIGNTLR